MLALFLSQQWKEKPMRTNNNYRNQMSYQWKRRKLRKQLKRWFYMMKNQSKHCEWAPDSVPKQKKTSLCSSKKENIASRGICPTCHASIQRPINFILIPNSCLLNKKKKIGPWKKSSHKRKFWLLEGNDLIKEVHYLYKMANFVVVNKKNGKSWVYIDFTNLNKACSNDIFPLPMIDTLVYATASHKMMSFLDAYS